MSQSLRPPSVPLVTADPYFSVWSPVDHLYDGHTQHWTNKRNSMTGIIRIDEVSRRFMGKLELDEDSNYEEPAAMNQTRLQVDPLTTKYVFEGGGIELEVDFTTPLLLDDLEVLSRPASYITFRVRSTDGQPHAVQIYFDITGEWCVNTPDQIVGWSRTTIHPQVEAMRMGSEDQPILQRSGDDTRIDWGYVYVAAPRSGNIQCLIHSYDIRKMFAETGHLPGSDDDAMPRAVQDNTPVMAAVLDFGQVNRELSSNYLVLAYDDIHSIEYFGKPLDAYWRRNQTPFEEMLVSSVTQYEEIMNKCQVFNKQLIDKSLQEGGEKYKDLLSLAYRQAIAAHKLVFDEEEGILFFSKENFSNGCMATVDVSYPSIPLFLLYNPELVKGMMKPIFRYASSGNWPYHFAPHDTGCYPKSNGQVYGLHEGELQLKYQMPIEECGNMLVMATAVCLYENNAQFAQENWQLLSQWAGYLKENGLDPDNQLCTDDFAGHLAHNVNLSVKAIIGIGAYSILCRMIGETEKSDDFYQSAKEMAAQWANMAEADDHYKLTFDSTADTWSMKYNLVWDRLFGLGLFPDEIIDKEIAYYKTQQNKYGTPLDSRNTYTKSDWLVWCASMAKSEDDFTQLITPLWDFLNESPSRVPFTDWYDTVSGKQIGFQNRSVVGGIFIKLLKPVTLT